MTSTGPVVTVLIALLVVGAIVHLSVLAYRYRKGEFDATERMADGDVVYRNDRLDGMGDERGREDDDRGLDFDPDESETAPCRECQTVNEMTYTFCRNCTAKLWRA